MSYCKTEVSFKARLALTQRGVALIPLLLAILTLLASAAAAWQWQRSDYHTQKAATATAQLLQIRNLNADAAIAGGFVSVTGNWLAASTTFVSPRLMDGRLGSQIVSVLRYMDAAGNPQHIAVQRGWAAQATPNTAPDIAPLTQSSVAMQGELVKALPRAYELKTIPPQRLGLWQNYDATAHAQLVNVTLHPQVLVLLPSSPDTENQQLRRTPADQTIATLKQKALSNQGYALQWLGLALVGLMGLGWMWLTRLNLKT